MTVVGLAVNGVGVEVGQAPRPFPVAPTVITTGELAPSRTVTVPLEKGDEGFAR